MGEIALLEGMAFTSLKVMRDDRGAVFHMVKNQPVAEFSIGEVYFSQVNPGVVKGWKRHQRMTQNVSVPVGIVRFVIFDPRESSSTANQVCVIETGPNQYGRIKIPPGLVYSFGCLSSEPALIVNCADLAHEAQESEAFPLSTDWIPYRWEKNA